MPGPITKYMPTEYDGIVIYNEQCLQVQDISTYIRRKIKGPEAKEYIIRKHKWDINTFSNIDWTGIQRYMKSTTIHKRLHIVQLMYNWQHIGHQKSQFLETQQLNNACQHNDEK